MGEEKESCVAVECMERNCYQEFYIGLKPNGIDLYVYKAPKAITPDFSLGILEKARFS